MIRREFLKSTTVALTAATPVAKAAAALFTTSHSRTIYPLNQGWLWSRETSPAAHDRTFDDSGFTSVTLPHTNVFVPWHSIDQNSYQFVSTYRRRFTLPAVHRSCRVFIDFEAAMTASRVFLNGTLVGEYCGGFTPFSFELTQLLDWSPENRSVENLLCVEVDSRELREVPPFGYEVDYLAYGGIYREASLRVVPQTFIDNLQVRTADVLISTPSVEIDLWLDTTEFETSAKSWSIDATLLGPEGGPAAHAARKLTSADLHSKRAVLHLRDLSKIKLWDLDSPTLYSARVCLLHNGEAVDQVTRRFGFREARFTPEGFSLNGKIVKLRGLNRHQSFPFAGPAMPARVQYRDAQILRHELKCNVVRCSHYPQSRHFLDACDELGLLVLDETPGWQHVGDSATWRERFLDNTRRMIQRDWNHPSVILWSIRINESRDFHDLYIKANALARTLDSTRQTTGVRYFQESELLEDVFSMNDFDFPLRAPNHPMYLNTEFVGAVYPVRPWDDNERHREHVLRYARIYNQINGDPRYAGGLGWCAFDYQTHADFGASDHICYHGIMDTFRLPKPVAGFFRSQCPPHEEIVLELGFNFAASDEPDGFHSGLVCSNCDEIKVYILQNNSESSNHEIITPRLVNQLTANRKDFPHLDHPPFVLTLPDGNDVWGDLRLEGYLAGRLAITKNFSSKGIDQRFTSTADDTELFADGSDATRVAFRVTDEYGNPRRLCFDPIAITIAGPATLLGETPVSLSAGVTAVWVRASITPGKVALTATHPHLGSQVIHIAIVSPASAPAATQGSLQLEHEYPSISYIDQPAKRNINRSLLRSSRQLRS